MGGESPDFKKEIPESNPEKEYGKELEALRKRNYAEILRGLPLVMDKPWIAQELIKIATVEKKAFDVADHIKEFKDRPWAKEVVLALVAREPLVLNLNLEDFMDQPWAGEVIQAVARKEGVESVLYTLLGTRKEPWHKTAKEAVMPLLEKQAAAFSTPKQMTDWIVRFLSYTPFKKNVKKGDAGAMGYYLNDLLVMARDKGITVDKAAIGKQAEKLIADKLKTQDLNAYYKKYIEFYGTDREFEFAPSQWLGDMNSMIEGLQNAAIPLDRTKLNGWATDQLARFIKTRQETFISKDFDMLLTVAENQGLQPDKKRIGDALSDWVIGKPARGVRTTAMGDLRRRLDDAIGMAADHKMELNAVKIGAFLDQTVSRTLELQIKAGEFKEFGYPSFDIIFAAQSKVKAEPFPAVERQLNNAIDAIFAQALKEKSLPDLETVNGIITNGRDMLMKMKPMQSYAPKIREIYNSLSAADKKTADRALERYNVKAE